MPRKISLDELNRLSVEDFKTVDKYPYILILDNVRSLNNVGSVFRTADAFRAEKIYLCGITGTPPHRDITKTALGATESVAWEHVQDVVALIDGLQQEGWIIAAIEQAEGSVSLQDFRPDANKKLAFVFGNEVTGVNDHVIEKADLILEIPQYGTKHSLNIAVTAGIVCWDFLTKLNKNLTH
ncbi:RNA methyltransferase [Larkinella knui]|uniref:TrmH family RNA methyltransferase n=1 Tax=Larkinella knui TaxID=2025310 RepID=A0A3P1CV68_9BACT|nr:RNA methyltransferase [Larkinella knui]RRB16990.1 TrmH family RNA methyltransferase [Larkinella knui]